MARARLELFSRKSGTRPFPARGKVHGGRAFPFSRSHGEEGSDVSKHRSRISASRSLRSFHDRTCQRYSQISLTRSEISHSKLEIILTLVFPSISVSLLETAKEDSSCRISTIVPRILKLYLFPFQLSLDNFALKLLCKISKTFFSLVLLIFGHFYVD